MIIALLDIIVISHMAAFVELLLVSSSIMTLTYVIYYSSTATLTQQALTHSKL